MTTEDLGVVGIFRQALPAVFQRRKQLGHTRHGILNVIA